MVDILWPIAKNKEGEYIPIGEALRGTDYFCPECNERMTARLGNIRRHHFGHYRNNAACCGESGYHFLAKHMLAYFLKQNPRIPYNSECPRCGEIIPNEKEIKDVQVEIGIDEDRPDLVARMVNGDLAYGEIVYRHPLGKKLEDYRSKHLDLFLWFIDGQVDEVPAMQLWLWKNFEIDALPEGELFFVSDFPVASHICEIKPGSSADKRKKAKAEHDYLRQKTKSELGTLPLDAHGCISRYEMTLWDKGRYGGVMFPRTCAKVYQKGRILLGSGFRQSVKKPYLFYLKVPYGSVFVDFGGTKEVPVWKEDGMVYGRLECNNDSARVIIDTVRQVLSQRGIETRFSFYDEYEPGGLHFGQNEAGEVL